MSLHLRMYEYILAYSYSGVLVAREQGGHRQVCYARPYGLPVKEDALVVDCGFGCVKVRGEDRNDETLE
jgi:hypothetical protein